MKSVASTSQLPPPEQVRERIAAAEAELRTFRRLQASVGLDDVEVIRRIVAGERSRRQNHEIADATPALREMISSGRLSKLMPGKIGGGVETKLIEQDGPIAFV